MGDVDEAFVALLAAAKGGSRDALGALFDLARPDLSAFAERALAADLRAKGGGSDLVQDALLEAQKLLARFDGTTADQFRAWLRAVLQHKIADFDRRYRRTEKRVLGREQALGPGDDGGVMLEAPGPGSTVAQREQVTAVAAAVAKLPAEYQAVIRMRTWDGLSFAAVGRSLNRSEDAARMLWCRAIERLRVVLQGGDSEPAD